MQLLWLQYFRCRGFNAGAVGVHEDVQSFSNSVGFLAGLLVTDTVDGLSGELVVDLAFV